ncbi:MAG: regulator of G-protein signaling domain-containing protein [Chloroflexota bacterium]
MPQAFGTFQKLSRQQKDQKSANQAAHEDENLADPKAALSLVEHASGDALHRSVLQLQRTIGNRAVSELVSQRSAPSAAIQREIEMESSGLPKLSTLFNQAAFEVSALVNVDTYKRWRARLPESHPAKTKNFEQAWAIKTLRPTILQFAQSEFSPENINFLLAVETYKEAPSADKAIQLYINYIQVGSASQVNIGAVTRGLYDAANASLTDAPVTRARS